MGNRVFQFLITLKDITPTIWRRIIVPGNYSFWDLHVAIQDSMGWMDCHLHVFRMRHKHSHRTIEIGIPDDDRFDDEPEVLPDWKHLIHEYFIDIGTKCEYEYDYGDSWIHEVQLEGILPREKGIKYPKCIGGARACPPEDCGGIPGYQSLLEVISNPESDEYEEMIQWLGDEFDPERFDSDKVKFDNPAIRWKKAFS